jgi:hypothetical protein
MKRRIGFLMISMVASALAAFLPGGPSEAGVASVIPLMVTNNSLLTDTLLENALTVNPIALRDLVGHKLATESFADPGLQLGDALRLDQRRTHEIMTYLVGCALGPSDPPVTWTDPTTHTVFSWPGQAGLCSEWKSGPASVACQERVSACMLARNNAFGVRVEIALRGRDPAGRGLALQTVFVGADPDAGTGNAPTAASVRDGSFARNLTARLPLPEDAYFTYREGAFFGNLLDPEGINGAAAITIKNGQLVGPSVHGSQLPLNPPVGSRLPSDLASGPVYKHMYACSSSVWDQPKAYMLKRICAGSSGDGAHGCAAQYTGSCREPSSKGPTGPVNVCSRDSGTGQKDYEDCAVAGKTWPSAMTVLLHDPCDMFPPTPADPFNHKLCALDPGPP